MVKKKRKFLIKVKIILWSTTPSCAVLILTKYIISTCSKSVYSVVCLFKVLAAAAQELSQPENPKAQTVDKR